MSTVRNDNCTFSRCSIRRQMFCSAAFCNNMYAVEMYFQDQLKLIIHNLKNSSDKNMTIYDIRLNPRSGFYSRQINDL